MTNSQRKRRRAKHAPINHRAKLRFETLENRMVLTSRVGAEFRVNTTTTDDQFLSAAAVNSAGEIAIVWDSVNQDGNGHGVIGRTFLPDGTPSSSEFVIPEATSGDQLFPRVSANSSGQMIVVWEGEAANVRQIFGRRFDDRGVALGGEFRVNTDTQTDQLTPAVDMSSAGQFVVAWDSFGQNNVGRGIRARRYDASGATFGDEIAVLDSNGNGPFFPDVASAGDQSFVVVWESLSTDGSGLGILSQRFDVQGNRIGAPTTVNTVTAGDQSLPSIGMNELGQYAIAWDSDSGTGHDIFVQRFGPDGTTIGGPIQINQVAIASRTRPKVSVDSSSNIVVVWDRLDADGNGKGVLARRLNSAGVPESDEFVVNSTVAGNQALPVVANADNGNFVVAWESRNQDGSGLGVFGQRFATPQAPVVDLNGADGAGRDFSTTFTEDLGPVSIVDSDLNVTDADSTTLVGATIVLTNPLDDDLERIDVELGATLITKTYDANTATLTLSTTSPQPISQFQEVLRSLKYANTSQNPQTTTRRVVTRVNDGGLDSVPATTTISVVAVNDAPIVDLDSASVGGGSTATYNEGQAPIAFSPNAEISDVDSTNLSSVRMRIVTRLTQTVELLSVDTSATTVQSTFDQATGTLVLSGATPQSLATFVQLVRSTKYSASGITTDQAVQQIEVVAADDTGSESNPVTATISISAQNHPPSIDLDFAASGNDATTRFDRATHAATLVPSAVISDVDSATLNELVVQIVNRLDGQQEQLSVDTLGTAVVATFNNTSGVLRLTSNVSQPIGDFQALLRRVVYSNSSLNPDATPRTLTATATDSSGLVSNTPTVTLVFDATNDPPIVDLDSVLAGLGADATFTEDQPPVLMSPRGTIIDSDSVLLQSMTLRIANALDGAVEGLDTDVSGTGISKAFDAASATLRLTASPNAALSDFQQALRLVTYANSSQNPTEAARMIEVVAVDDSGSRSDLVTAVVTVVPVNDPPNVDLDNSRDGRDASATFVEDGQPIVFAPLAAITDVDNTTLNSISLRLTNQVDGTAESLSVDLTGTSITLTANSTADRLTLSSTPAANVIDFQTVLRRATYNHTSQSPTPGIRLIEVEATDAGGATSVVAVASITVVPVNDPPLLDLDFASPGADSTTSVNRGNNSAIIAPSATISDIDSATLDSLDVQFLNRPDGQQEVLSADTTGTTLVASFTPDTGALRLTAATPQPLADFQAVLRRLTYTNGAQTPTLTPRLLTVSATDSSGAASNVATATLSFAATNDPPVVDLDSLSVGVDSAATYTEDQPPVLISPRGTIVDSDSLVLQSLTLRITNVFDNGAEIIDADVTGTGISKAFDANTDSLRLTASTGAALSEFQQVLRTVNYVDTSQNPNPTVRVLEVVGVDDSGNRSNLATAFVTVVPVNDPPLVDLDFASPGNDATTNVDRSNNSAIVASGALISDVDHATLSSVEVQFASRPDGQQEVLSTDTTGTTLVASFTPDTGALRLTAATPQSLADFQTVLRRLTYTNGAQTPTLTPRLLTVTATDGSGAQSNMATATISFPATNDPPVVDLDSASPGLGSDSTYVEDQPPVLVSVRATIVDTDSSVLQSVVARITNPLDGAAERLDANVAGTPITKSYDSATATLRLTAPSLSATSNFQQVLRTLSYLNTSQNPATPVRAIEVVITDDVGNRSTLVTANVTVVPVNDPPQIDLDSTVLGTGFETASIVNAAATQLASNSSIEDLDSDQFESVVVRITSPRSSFVETLDADVGTTSLSKQFDPSTSTLRLLGSPTASRVDFERAMRTVTYRISGTGPLTGQQLVEFVARDSGGAASNTATATIQVTSRNVPPQLDLNGAESGVDSSTTIPLTQVPVGIARNDLTITDSDGNSLITATITLTSPITAAEEKLDVDVSGTAISKVFVGNQLRLTTTTPQSIGDFERVLRTLTYANNGQTAAGVTRRIEIVVHDGTDQSNVATISVSIAAAQTSSIAGFVFVDANSNGRRDPVEVGIPNVTVTLAGTQSRIVVTARDGSYRFDGLPAGTYSILETHPDSFLDGPESLGVPALGQVGDDRFVDIVLSAGVTATEYNFGEASLRPDLISKRYLLGSTPSSATSAAAIMGLGSASIVAGTATANLSTRDANVSSLDANRDGFVTAADALAVINRVNGDMNGEAGESTAASLLTLDVNRDGYVTPLDALVIINEINSASGAVEGESRRRFSSGIIDESEVASLKPNVVDAWFAEYAVVGATCDRKHARVGCGDPQ